MSDPVTSCADVVIHKALDGYPPERILAMIAPGDRAGVARLVGLELACQTLEAAGLRTAPDRFAERVLLGEQGSGLRRLARLLIEIHRAMEAARAEALTGARRLVGLRRPPLMGLALAAWCTLGPAPTSAEPLALDLSPARVCELATRPIPEPMPPSWAVLGVTLLGLGWASRRRRDVL